MNQELLSNSTKARVDFGTVEGSVDGAIGGAQGEGGTTAVSDGIWDLELTAGIELIGANFWHSPLLRSRIQPVARMERSGIRDSPHHTLGSASLHPGYSLTDAAVLLFCLRFPGRRPMPGLAGITFTRFLLLQANTPWNRV